MIITIKSHWDRVGDMRCVVSGRPSPTLHHVHSGSIAERGFNRGAGQKMSDWLVIPLDAEFHTGNNGIDGFMPVDMWEELFGNQADHVDEVIQHLGYNVWELAARQAIKAEIEMGKIIRTWGGPAE